MKRLLSELQRRRVFQTAALYVVAAWLVLQVADVVLPALEMPEQSIRYVLFAAILGFPAVLVIGWFFDIGAQGISRTLPASSGQTQPLRKLDYVILTTLLVVTAAAIYSMVGKVADGSSAARERSTDGPPMVAVLPFTAVSMGEDNEFFAVGVHDDLLTQLSQLESLRVISRTSVLEYKDTVRNIREIGARLGADVILEGGIQTAGGRVRINAQLIDAYTDEHLWANTFDREMTATNIFDVQAEIARAIAKAMHTTLTPQDLSQLAVIPTESLAAYREYLRAMKIRNTERVWMNDNLQEALEKAVELDPEFTRAMAELVGHLTFVNFFHEERPEAIPQSEALLERIQVLAPDSADHLIAKYYYTYYTLKDFPRAYEFIKQAERLRPSDMGLLQIKLYILRRLGLFDERIETVRKMQGLDPLGPSRDGIIVYNMMMTHRYDDARQEAESSEDETVGIQYWRTMLDLNVHGDIGRWAAEMQRLYDKYGDELGAMPMWEAHIANRDFEQAAELVSALEAERSDKGVYLSDQDIANLQLWSLTGNESKLLEPVSELRSFLDQSRDKNGEFINGGTNLQWALLAAIEGDQAETIRSVRRAIRSAAGDVTHMSAEIASACQILAIVSATQEAVECLRGALTSPSVAFLFLEPHLPYYDSIRNEPEFIELLAGFE